MNLQAEQRRQKIAYMLAFAAGLIFDWGGYLIASSWKSQFDGINFELLFYLATNSFLIFPAVFLTSAVSIERIGCYSRYVAMVFSCAAVGLFNIANHAGIIMVSWHGAIGFYAGFSLVLAHLAESLRSSIESIPQGDAQYHQRLLSIKADMWEILKLALQSYLALFAITGVCMTILFKTTYEDLQAKANAVQMLIGLGGCTVPWFCIGIIPFLDLIQEIRKKGY